MTLILNEIHLRDGLADTFQIAAADRRITYKGHVEPARKKLFVIPYLNATVSYFGLAAFTKSGQIVYLADWLPSFIARNRESKSIEAFTKNLRDALMEEVPSLERKSNKSGFHISGYRPDGLPEFWHFSNIPGMTGLRYNEPVESYGPPGSDFLQRDAINRFGWDGKNPKSARNGGFVYRNGDIRAHVHSSERLDEAMKEIMKSEDFRKPVTIEEYADYIKFKFEIIKFVYKRWAKLEIIGDKVDVMILTKGGVQEKKAGKWEFLCRSSNNN